MRKIFYMIRCFLANAKAMRYLKDCNVSLTDEMVDRFGRCEMANINEAFHLMGVGFNPAYADYGNNAKYDNFYFRRSAALLMALHDYNRKINDAVDAVTWDQIEPLYEIPTSKFTPTEDDDASFAYVPFGYARERFAYLNWPAEVREKYISSSADSRKEMVAAAYGRG